MGYQRGLLFAACCAAVVAACRKEEALSPPTVEILSPTAGSTFVMPDTLRVTVRVDDDASVERVTAVVLNTNGVPIADGAFVVPGALPATVTIDIPLTTEHFEGGTGRIWVSASDGSNTTNAYSTLHLVPVPLRLRNIYAVCGAGTTTTLHRVDSSGTLTLANSFNMALSGATTVNKTGTVVLSGGSTGDLMALDATGQQMLWSQPNTSNGGEAFFAGLANDGGERVLVGTSVGQLRAFQAANGIGLLNGDLAGKRVERIAADGTLIVCSVRNVANTARWIRVHTAASGVPLHEHPLDLDPKGLFLLPNDVVMVFGNRNGQGVLGLRDAASGAGWEPYTWPSDITAVERISTDQWLVALANGTLERYVRSNNSALPIGPGLPIADMALDPVSGTVYAASDQQIVQLDPASGTVMATWNTGNPVRYVRTLLNR